MEIPTLFVHGQNLWPGTIMPLARKFCALRGVAEEPVVVRPGIRPARARAYVADYLIFKGRRRVPARIARVPGCPRRLPDGRVDAQFEALPTYADRLRWIIDGIRQATGAPRVDVVAHSLGGLVARACVAFHEGHGVGRLLMLACPNHGVSRAAMRVARYGLRWKPYRFLPLRLGYPPHAPWQSYAEDLEMYRGTVNDFRFGDVHEGPRTPFDRDGAALPAYVVDGRRVSFLDLLNSRGVGVPHATIGATYRDEHRRKASGIGVPILGITLFGMLERILDGERVPDDGAVDAAATPTDASAEFHRVVRMSHQREGWPWGAQIPEDEDVKAAAAIADVAHRWLHPDEGVREAFLREADRFDGGGSRTGAPMRR